VSDDLLTEEAVKDAVSGNVDDLYGVDYVTITKELNAWLKSVLFADKE
jgi:hypothetical protein